MIAFAMECAPIEATLTLAEVKRRDCLRLDREVMNAEGAAALTLAAVLRLAYGTGETFASSRIIADIARLPHRTCERHLALLVERGWLKRLNRQNRRTPTYRVPTRILGDDRRFCLFPRWAACYLSGWKERAVFAAIVSRDSLAEAVPDSAPVEYPAKMIARDTGLSLRAVGQAKAELESRGLIFINAAGEPLRDESGRLRTAADTVLLNPAFEVASHLIDRSAEMAGDRSANLAVYRCADLAEYDASRSAEMAGEGRINGGCHSADLAVGGRINGGCSDRQILNQSSKESSKSTAKPPNGDSAAVAMPLDKWQKVEEELRELGVAKAHEAVDIARRRSVPVSDAQLWIDEYRAKPGAWKPGALFQRFTGDMATWPQEAPEYLSQQSSRIIVAGQTARRHELDDCRKRRHAEAKQLEELELLYGNELDRMGDDAQFELFLDAHRDPVTARYDWNRARKAGRLSGPQRSDVLKAMKASREEANA